MSDVRPFCELIIFYTAIFSNRSALLESFFIQILQYIQFIFFRQMSGDTVPDDWRGGMTVTYRFGGSFKTPGWYACLASL